jgi:cell division protein FtsI/penicillin-binding protein 2
MTVRGRLTIGALLAVPVAAAWALADPEPEARPEPGAAASRAAPLVTAIPPPLPTVPESILERLPASREAFAAARGEAEVSSARTLVESVGVPDEVANALPGPLRIQYTLDAELSTEVFDILARGRVELGHALVMDAGSGDLLAWAATDVQRFPPTKHYPAASLVKVVTASAALERDPHVVDWPCRYVGNPWRLTKARIAPPRGGLSVSLRRALGMSNNQCFAQLAVHRIGRGPLLESFERFGLLEPPAPGHAAGVALDPGSDAYALGLLGSGLAGSRITPLHAVRMAAVLADGRLHEARWIARVSDGRGRVLDLPPLAPPRRVLEAAQAATLRELMVETTISGTARRAFRSARGPVLDDVRVAGKTGSLSGHDPDGRYEWFVAVAPAERPRVAVAVLLVQGRRWWSTPSQIAAEMLKVLFCPRGVCRADAVERWLPGADEPVLARRAAGAK